MRNGVLVMFLAVLSGCIQQHEKSVEYTRLELHNESVKDIHIAIK